MLIFAAKKGSDVKKWSPSSTYWNKNQTQHHLRAVKQLLVDCSNRYTYIYYIKHGAPTWETQQILDHKMLAGAWAEWAGGRGVIDHSPPSKAVTPAPSSALYTAHNLYNGRLQYSITTMCVRRLRAAGRLLRRPDKARRPHPSWGGTSWALPCGSSASPPWTWRSLQTPQVSSSVIYKIIVLFALSGIRPSPSLHPIFLPPRF